MDTTKLQKFFRDCPPVGKGLPYVVNCDNKPVAGFDNREDAVKALAMYRQHNGVKSPSDKAHYSSRWSLSG